jgi:eukaryotic-like serine/threonine-protein kinase
MPKSAKLAAFVEAVRASNLLKPVDWESFASAADAPEADPEPLARNLVQRGLLTAYQAKALWRGRVAELFLNQYVLIEKLGEGGMGEVYRARHLRLDRDVALKIMRRERLANPEAVKRFRREIKASAALAHENVVMAYDADQSGETHFFAMEYVDGTTLDKYVQAKGRLPVDEACDYIRQAALGLQHAHEKGLTHRDIKPSNLLLDKGSVVKISDLGLVLLGDPDDLSRITREGLTVGTPDFVAPEQARNPRAADIRADIYSLGCTFYFLLTGEVPFPGGTATEKMLRQSRENVPMPKRDDVAPEVLAILVRMTAKKPDQRFQSPAEVAAAVQPFVRRPAQPDFPTPIPASEERLTDDELPIARASTDSRFALPPTTAEPRVRRKGCLSIVIGFGGLAGIAAIISVFR